MNLTGFCGIIIVSFKERKEDDIMKIAVTYENGNVFPHFGHTEQFKLYDIEDGKVVCTQIVDTAGNGHGALAGFLSGQKVDTLLCGGTSLCRKRRLQGMRGMNGHKFWSCLLLISCIMCIVTGHQIIKHV